jgi:chitinase
VSRQRLIAFLAALAAVVGLVILVPLSSPASAATCASAWNSSSVYTGGMTASYNTHNWSAKWWTQGETPGAADVWADQGSCTGGSGGTGGTTGGSGSCSYPAWAAGHAYVTGDVVRYTNGLNYIATHDNPGYDPTISTWYWSPYTCSGTGGTTGGTQPPTSGFVVSEAQFNQMFPGRNSFYTYAGLTAALSAYPGFANTGSDTVKKQEAAAFLANVSHETGGLVYITEIDKSGNYCAAEPYGCPAGTYSYYGRGPIQLSWNFNYKAAGDSLGIDLLDNPGLVETDPAISWKTGLWYWNTQTGPGTMTAHNAMVNGAGFGETIRSINGSIECNGGNPAQVQSRINAYQSFTAILGVPTGSNLSC